MLGVPKILVNLICIVESLKLTSTRTIQYIFRVLNNILKRAAKWKLIKDNPMYGVERPKVVMKEADFYDEDEAKEIIIALYNEPRKWMLFVLGAMIGGFRRGELVGLEWKSVNLDEGTLDVENSIAGSSNTSL